MRLYFYGVALLISLLTSPAFAAPRDPDLPRLDGKNEWHMIGPTAKTTQSKCIGQTTTPVCAIETYEACLVRHNDRLCKIASASLKVFVPESQDPRPSPEQYRVNRAFRLNRNNVPSWELTSKHHLRQIGDIEVEIRMRNCTATACSPYGELAASYVLRHIDSRWNVVGRVDCTTSGAGSASGGPCSVSWPYSTP